MKGLFCRTGESEPKFVIQETILPDVLENHEVRVKVTACGLRPLDLKLLDNVGIGSELVPVGRDVTGVVLQVGPKVTTFQPQDEVVGILPLDSSCSGLCDLIHIDENHLVLKPSGLSSLSVVAALQDGVAAYTALHSLARMAAGQTLLVMGGASPFGLMCIQLACYHGLKVLTTAGSPQDQVFLEQLRPSVGRVIPVYDGTDLLSEVLEETGGLGVDIVVDSGVRLHDKGDEPSEDTKLLPHKHEVLSVLGVWGHWVTSHQDLQLDPPDCRLLHLKSASVSFLNAEVWTASRSQQGRFLHILKDVVEKMSAGVLRPRPQEPLPVYEATVAMETVQRHPGRKAIVQI
ncbi:unnamed protein product [Ophioblennius macclurei]